MGCDNLLRNKRQLNSKNNKREIEIEELFKVTGRWRGRIARLVLPVEAVEEVKGSDPGAVCQGRDGWYETEMRWWCRYAHSSPSKEGR